jgi:hypothetical protein
MSVMFPGADMYTCGRGIAPRWRGRSGARQDQGRSASGTRLRGVRVHAGQHRGLGPCLRRSQLAAAQLVRHGRRLKVKRIVCQARWTAATWKTTRCLSYVWRCVGAVAWRFAVGGRCWRGVQGVQSSGALCAQQRTSFKASTWPLCMLLAVLHCPSAPV